jgi:hypothetical protein
MGEVKKLGEDFFGADFLFNGYRKPGDMVEILNWAVELIKMDTAGMAPDIRHFPIADGRGGVGETFFQPFVERKVVLQELQQSFILSDSWPALNKTWVLLRSCQEFDFERLGSFLARHIGPLTKKLFIKF